MPDRRRRVAPSRFAVILLAFALLVKLLVPAGWMPSAAGHGFAIEMCNGEGPISPEMAAAMKAASDRLNAGKAKTGKDKAGADPVCPFAAMTFALAEPAAAGIVPPAKPAAISPAPAYTVSIGRGLVAPPPPATGPPALA